MKKIMAILSAFTWLAVSTGIPAAAQDDVTPDTQALIELLTQGQDTVTPGELLLNEPFDTADLWSEYEEPDSSGKLDDGSYRMTSLGDFYSWRIGFDVYADVVIQVDAHQNSENGDNDYGVICRAEVGSGTGYYFLISGDGYYTIRRLTATSDGREPLVDWTASEFIHPGQADNRITAVCAGDYLALYVNGHLLAEVRNSEFNSGYAGITVGAYSDNAVIDVSFDNLLIWQASPENPIPVPDNRIQPADPIGITLLLNQGSQTITPGDVLLNEPFDAGSTWEEIDEEGTTGELAQGEYRMTLTGDFYTWSVSEDSYSDVVIVVDTHQNSEGRSSDYGITCRSSAKFGAGYYFLVGSDGYYTIRKMVDASTGREELVPWTPTRYINPGQADNQVVAVCTGDYLALYVNGHLLAELNDPDLTEGKVGFSVGAYEVSSVADISFDNLVIWQAGSQ